MDNKAFAKFMVYWVSLFITVAHPCYSMPSTDLRTSNNYANGLGLSSEVDKDWRDSEDHSLSPIDLSSENTLGDYQDEGTPYFRDWQERGFLGIKKSIKTKRKGHEVARMFMTSLKECVIINSKGEVTASKKISTCNTYGKFCHKVSGSSLQLLNMKTGKYLAMNKKGLIYSTDDSTSKDTILTDVIANHNNFSIYIYKVIKSKKCYLNVNSNSALQSCSLLPKALTPNLLGTCT